MSYLGYRYKIVEWVFEGVGNVLTGEVIEVEENPRKYVVQWSDGLVTTEDSCDGEKVL